MSFDPPPSAMTPLEDQDPTSIPPFRVKGRLGAGGMGVVYGAVSPDGDWVAIKVIRDEYAKDAGFRARFARETDLVQRVRAPCIAPVLAAETDGPRPWYATPYVPGPTLSQHISAAGALPASRVRVLALGMADAIAAIHDAGVVHRDLKPTNVILAPDGPKVLDFGIARAVDETAITSTGQLVGSPGWVSPERFRGDSGPPADVFCWGALVAYAATGRPPFGSGSAETLMYRVLHAEPDLVGIPEGLAEPVALALSKDPHQRPASAELARRCSGADHPATTEVTTLVESAIVRHWPRDSAAASPPGGQGTDDGNASQPAPAGRRFTRLSVVLGAATALALSAAIGTWVSVWDGEPEQPNGASDQGTPAASSPAAPEHSPNTEAEPLRFAALLPESGPLDFIEPPAKAGIDLAVADINEAGGVRGTELPDAEGFDEGQEPGDVIRASDDILHEGVDAVIGPTTSSSVLSVIDRFASADVVMCSGSAEAPELTETTEALFFRTVPAAEENDSAETELSQYDPPAGFKERLVEFTDDLEEFHFSAHYYDCVVTVALASEAAGSSEASEIAQSMARVTQDGESCSSFGECRDLLEDSREIDYQGASGPIAFDDNGDVTEGS
ncbi:serine/threonine protein kinase [Lipingzhangella halophila]|uniref:Serine/threonine protein kinase n=1 Tax=Lipingzhangella halophila TaxID=1783352 RepID=A0A7W7W0U3_9ACTN|nr:protein kinase [Lipingzhangella halophila]MBB4929971.1 serine/threonine protein kinase [Lipingzhangella halophila]